MTNLAMQLQPRPRRQAGHLGALKYLSVGRTHVGCVRERNEDAFLDRPDVGLWAVADGMGGHEAGGYASAQIVESLSAIACFRSAYAFRHAACLALHESNAALRQRGSPCGSTIVTLLVHQGHFACLWAGDSRAYLYRDGEMRRLTRDHSLVQGLVDAGQITDEEARNHRAGHVITRAVGAAEVLDLESAHGPVRAGDRFLLCSDGVTGLLRDAELAQIIRRPPLESAVERIVSTALARGAPDNVTALLVAAEAG